MSGRRVGMGVAALLERPSGPRYRGAVGVASTIEIGDLVAQPALGGQADLDVVERVRLRVVARPRAAGRSLGSGIALTAAEVERVGRAPRVIAGCPAPARVAPPPGVSPDKPNIEMGGVPAVAAVPDGR